MVVQNRNSGLPCSVACNANGIPCLLIEKNKRPRCFKNVKRLPI
jgi:hypothetical protein